MKSPIILLRSLLHDCKRLENSVKGLDRDIISIEGRFKNEGYGFLAIALPALGRALQQGLSSGQFSCPPGFKTIREGTIPVLLQGMFSEIFEPLTGHVREEVNFGTLRNLYQVLFLFKKVKLSEESNDKLHSKAVSSFFENDKIATQVRFPERETYRLRAVSRFIMPKLRLNNFGLIKMKHGPGAVKERLKTNQKWLAVADSIFRDSFDTVGYEYDTFATSLDSLLSRESNGMSAYATPLQSFDYGPSRSSARLISVPKDSSSNRTITVEPLLNQFIQQGLNTILRDNILKCDILRQCLTLTDQTKNQHLALEGSLTGEWSTIDLKSASDLMSISLVDVVFSSFEDFRIRMVDCRTQSVDNDGVAISLGKFAGMGNALTFPVQSIVFAVIAMTAILDSQNKNSTKGNLMQASRHIRVYGDDIIVRAKYAHCVVHWLTLFGLKTNERKSFLVGNFKESCGVDAYKGVDITPIYVKPRPDQTSTEPSVIASLVAFSNQAWLAGLYETSACIKAEVEERIGYELPLVSSNSGALGWHSRQDASYATRWCNKLHQLLVRAPIVLSKSRKDPLDGWAALLKFFHVPLIGRPPNHLQSTSARFQLRIVKRWVPVLLTENRQSH